MTSALVNNSSNDLPEHWCIQLNLDNFDEIYKGHYGTLDVNWIKRKGYGLSHNNNSNYWALDKHYMPEYYQEITLEQFRKHILKK
jgi:hypothetical protein